MSHQLHAATILTTAANGLPVARIVRIAPSSANSMPQHQATADAPLREHACR